MYVWQAWKQCVEGRLSYLWSVFVLISCLGLLVADSAGEEPNEGGYNRGQQKSGNAEGGTRLWLGHIAVHPSGKYFISRVKNTLVLGNVRTRKTERLEGLTNIERLVFDPRQFLFYATQTVKDYKHIYLLAYDMEAKKQLWRVELLGRENLDQLRLDVEPSTNGLLLSGNSRIRMIEASSGNERWRWFPKIEKRKELYISGVVDVDLVSRIGKVVVTVREKWVSNKTDVPTPPKGGSSRHYAGQLLKQSGGNDDFSLSPKLQPKHKTDTAENTQTEKKREPKTKLFFLTYSSGKETSTEVPNCGGELLVAQGGRRAFLAPTRCKPPPPKPKKDKSNAAPRSPRKNAGYDPVSVIDLVKESWEVNLPGFGPVALSTDGSTAVAFIDQQAMDASLFGKYGKQPSSDGPRYLLMFINTRTLQFTSMDIGNTLPRYGITPDGKLLLIDASTTYAKTSSIRILDIEKRKIRAVKGPSVRMDHFALTPDSQEIYLLDKSLYHLLFSVATLEKVKLAFTPASLNISPQGDILFLKDEKTHNIHLYCLYTASLCGQIENNLHLGVKIDDKDKLLP